MGWIGPAQSVQNYLSVVGADRGEDGRYIISGAPVLVGLGGDELVVPDETVYFVRGDPKNLAAGMSSTSGGVGGVKVFDKGPGYRPNPNTAVNPRDFAEALLGEEERWTAIEVGDQAGEDGLWAHFEVECPEELSKRANEATEKRMVGALTHFLDAEYAATIEGQQLFRGRGWGRPGKPRWRGRVKSDGYAEEFYFDVEVPVPETESELGRILYVLGRLDQAVSHLASLCGLRAKTKHLSVPTRKGPRAAMTPEYIEALEKQKKERTAAAKREAEVKANLAVKKGRYRLGRPSRSGTRVSYELLRSGKPVGVTFYQRDDGQTMASFTKISWQGARPAAPFDPAGSLFFDMSFPLHTPIHTVFGQAVDKVEAIENWRKTGAKKKPAKKKAKAAPKKKAKKKPAKKPAKKAPKKKAKKKAKKASPPTARAAKTDTQGTVDLLKMARWARGEK